MGLTEVFTHKKTGRKVTYKDICTLESIIEEEDVEGGIIFSTRKEDVQTCILCEDFNTHHIYAIPIIQFMNYYEPAANRIQDLFDTLDKLKTEENEGHTENIHTLHSGESETDSSSAPEGVQE